MKFTLEIDMGNAAFEDSNSQEVSLILATLAKEFENIPKFRKGNEGIVFDVNGNRVGRWSVKNLGKF